MTRSPYFDVLFQRLAHGNAETTDAFGRHVHWGYWAEPRQSRDAPTASEFGEAAERLCDQVLEKAKITDGQSVLDVGCGFGGAIAVLNDRCRGLSMTGVNIDGRQLERAQQTVKPRNDNQVRWVEGDACDLPLPLERAFHVTLAIECIFHFDSRLKFFQSAARRLRSDGRIVISDFIPSDQLAAYLRENSNELPGRESMAASYGTVNLETTLDEYRALARQTGMELAATCDITTQTLPTYDFLLDNLRHWEDQTLAQHYGQATKWLAGASKRGMLSYQILTFEQA